MVPDPTNKRFQVIVIGAGLSGLSAGKILMDHGIDYLVLESRDRVGGRTYAIKNKNVGDWLELGGAYIGPTQDRIIRQAKDVGVETYITNEEENTIWYEHGKTTLFKGAFPVSNPIAVMDLNNVLRQLDINCTKINLDAPWLSEHAEEWDKKTMSQFLDETCWTKTGRQFAELFVMMNVACMPHEISMLWFHNHVAAAGGVLRIVSTTNGGQERKFVGGSQEISKRLALKQGLGSRILLDHPVQQLHQDDVGCTLTTANGRKFKCDYVIMAVPGAMQGKILYSPPLPPLRNQLLQRMEMGSVTKVHMFYKRNFWRPKGMCGSALIFDKNSPIHFTLDDTKPDGTFPAIMGFIVGDESRSFAELTRDQRKAKLAEVFSKVFESEEALYPIHYEDKVWAEEQWSGGCYGITMKPGVFTQYGKVMREPVGKMHIAASETANKWAGFMDGAVQSGERAAREILFELGLINRDEIWQSEPPSAEVIARPFPSTFMARNMPSVPDFLKFVSLTTAAAATGAVLYNKMK